MAQQNTQAQPESLQEKLARLEAENLKLKEEAKNRATGGGVRVKLTVARLPGTNGADDKGVTTSGRISMYGIQRFPITLGIDQFNRMYSYMSGPEWKEFVKAHAHEFSHKS